MKLDSKSVNIVKHTIYHKNNWQDKVGISPTHMSHIETGNTKLSLVVLVNIANTLSVQTDELIFNKPQVNKTAMKEEVADILNSCSVHDMYVLIDVIKSVKISLDKHKDK